ncbi:MAG TPA: hypothetical protein VMZ28_27355, partial [Kofleriaceae bacterium]|nr:hypothetical protein [Kofleriaceae bacterium]
MRGAAWVILSAAGLSAAGCGGAPSCPDGTHARGERPPNGRMTWCERPTDHERFGPVIAAETLEGHEVGEPRAYDSDSIQGPVTSWHENGRIEAYGTYEVHRGQSVPHGIWTFWWNEGQLKSRGRYINGHRVGCFAVWTRHGAHRTTAFAEGGHLRVADCEPPRHEEADFTAHEVGGAPREPRGDIALSYFLAPVGSFGGASSTGPSVDIEHAIALRAQRRF